MRKYFRLTKLPIIMGLIIAFILLGGQITKAEQKNKQLEDKIVKLSSEVKAVAGSEVVASTESSVVNNNKSEIIADPTPDVNIDAVNQTSTPVPTPTATTKPKSRPTSAPTPAPTPTPTPREIVTVEIQGLSNYEVELIADDTAYSVLLRAASENGFMVDSETYEGLGAFVTCIAGSCQTSNSYWTYYYNGAYAQVGASVQTVAAGDIITWKLESF